MRVHKNAVRIRVGARFSFFAALGFMICTDVNGVSVMCAVSCILHEFGHLAVMLAEGRPPSSVELYGGGIHISGGSTSFPAAFAGVAVNMALFLVFGAVPWNERTVRLFGAVNLLIAAFNLMPVGELDGKLLLDKALTRAFEPRIAVRMSEICEKLVLALMIPTVAMLVFSGILNFSAIIFLIYILAVEILEKV